MKEKLPKAYTPKEKQDRNRDAEILHQLENRYAARAERYKGTVAGQIFDLESHALDAVKVVNRLSLSEIENLTDEQKERLGSEVREILKSGTTILKTIYPEEKK